MAISRDGWAWVLANGPLIERAAKFYAYTGGYDPDDFHQELVLRLARRQPDYDPSKGAVSTWVRYQARAVSSYFRDGRVRRGGEWYVGFQENEIGARLGKAGAAEKVENSTTITMLQRGLPALDWQCVVARALSYSEQECRESLGMSRWSVSRRALRAGARIK